MPSHRRRHKVNLKNICTNKNRHCVIIISKQKLGWSSSKAEKSLDDNIDVAELVIKDLNAPTSVSNIIFRITGLT
jgi:hypothetical protein